MTQDKIEFIVYNTDGKIGVEMVVNGKPAGGSTEIDPHIFPVKFVLEDGKFTDYQMSLNGHQFCVSAKKKIEEIDAQKEFKKNIEKRSLEILKSMCKWNVNRMWEIIGSDVLRKAEIRSALEDITDGCLELMISREIELNMYK